MTKKRSRNLFIAFAMILVICLIASFVSFALPVSFGGNYYSYSNFVENIKLGQDISDGLRIVYRTDLPEGENRSNYDYLLSSTIKDLKDIVQSSGYKDVTITNYGDDGICVHVGNILNKSKRDELIDLVGSPETISFSSTDSADGSIAKASDVKSVEVFEDTTSSVGTIYYVKIDFKDSAKIKAATENASAVYIYFGETKFTSIPLSNAITNGSLMFTSEPDSNGNGGFIDYNTTNIYVNKIKTGMLALELTQIECSTVTPSYGAGADFLIMIAIVIFVIIAFAFLIYKYKHLGWLACFNLLFFTVISLFLIQSIPFVHVNFAGIIAMMIMFIMAIDSLMCIFEKAKEHYQSDTKLYISLKLAIKENRAKSIITNLMFAILGFVCIFIPSMPVQSFGMITFIMSLTNLFTSQLLMRLFINMYLPFNSQDGKKCNFHKGGKYVK